MTHWTSKNAILRDLSEAQGYGVPVDIVDTVASGDKPPTPNFLEETEEEYFEHCTGSGDALPIPDFGLIRQMLNVVQQSNTSDDDEESKSLDEVVTLNTNATKEVNNTTYVIKKIKPKRLHRNVAVQSILEAIGKEVCNENQVKTSDVFKTEDSRVIDNNISNQKTLDNTNDVNSRQNSPANSRPLALDPVNMFRKKTSKKLVTKEESKPTSGQKNNNAETYKPSELASEYYKKYVERSKLKESMQDDIWTRAEKKMKEIEAMKKLQPSQSAQSNNAENKTEVSKSN